MRMGLGLGKGMTGNREGPGTPPPPMGSFQSHTRGDRNGIGIENGAGTGNGIGTGNGNGMGWDWEPPPSRVLRCPNLLCHVRALPHTLLQQDLEHFLQEFLPGSVVQAGIVQWDAVPNPRGLSHGRRTQGNPEMRWEGP